MERMRDDLDSGMTRYEEASDKLAATRAKIAENGKRLEKLDLSIKDGQERLAGRAEFQYRTGTPGMIDVLLGASSFEDFSARLYVFSEIAKQDDALLNSIKAERAEAISLRAELKEREKAQVAERDQVASRRASVQKQVDAQEAYLDSLSAEVSALVAAEDKAKSAAKAVAKSSSKPIKAPKPTKAPISKAGAIVMATVEGRTGKYAVLSGDPMNYRPTGREVLRRDHHVRQRRQRHRHRIRTPLRRERVHLRPQDAAFRHAAGGQQGRQERHRDRDRPRSVHARPDA